MKAEAKKAKKNTEKDEQGIEIRKAAMETLKATNEGNGRGGIL